MDTLTGPRWEEFLHDTTDTGYNHFVKQLPARAREGRESSQSERYIQDMIKLYNTPENSMGTSLFLSKLTAKVKTNLENEQQLARKTRFLARTASKSATESANMQQLQITESDRFLPFFLDNGEETDILEALPKISFVECLKMLVGLIISLPNYLVEVCTLPRDKVKESRPWKFFLYVLYNIFSIIWYIFTQRWSYVPDTRLKWIIIGLTFSLLCQSPIVGPYVMFFVNIFMHLVDQTLKYSTGWGFTEFYDFVIHKFYQLINVLALGEGAKEAFKASMQSMEKVGNKVDALQTVATITDAKINAVIQSTAEIKQMLLVNAPLIGLIPELIRRLQNTANNELVTENKLTRIEDMASDTNAQVQIIVGQHEILMDHFQTQLNMLQDLTDKIDSNQLVTEAEIQKAITLLKENYEATNLASLMSLVGIKDVADITKQNVGPLLSMATNALSSILGKPLRLKNGGHKTRHNRKMGKKRKTRKKQKVRKSKRKKRSKLKFKSKKNE
jgi:hypothetical protein